VRIWNNTAFIWLLLVPKYHTHQALMVSSFDDFQELHHRHECEDRKECGDCKQ
jgi:hypothetical protein